ncbi:MAG: PadR family transcriptional regulator [Actinomycetales bacterium]|jgi:PadR family transcriptional regulator PadR|nr:PadR family transcriptional regulator [Actinomycetales bacterium]
MATSSTPWPGDWLRGVLEIAVLRCLADGGPSYGYAIALALEEAGLGQVKGGTLYPLLGRLEEAGHVAIEWRPGEGGPGRKYYEITASGTAYLGDSVAQWRAFARTMSALLEQSPSPTA